MQKLEDDVPSKLAAYARSLDPGLRHALRLDDASLLVIETLVAISRTVSTPGDRRPWTDRLADLISNQQLSQLQQVGAAFKETLEAQGADEWIRRFRSEGYKIFAERLLGPGEYRSFICALKADAAVVALAVRRLVRAIVPFAAAWNEAISLMSREQLKQLRAKDVLALNAVQLVVQLDMFIGEKLLAPLPMNLAAATEADLEPWDADDVAGLALRFRSVVSEASAQRVERASSPLVRKIRGARDALKYSEDGVSQAANSLIELIDRLMRETFPPALVLEWIDANFPQESGLTWLDEGKRKPSKLGEALCFVYSCAPVEPREPSQYDTGEGPSLIHRIIAMVFVSARNKLQKLKHADSGVPKEREQLQHVLTALEGALMLGLTFGGRRLTDVDPVN
ncbi:hypothetical protein [Streptomyces sp. NPDC054834]